MNEPLGPGHRTFEQVAAVPNERRRFGWVVVCMARSSGRGRRTWNAFGVVGFFAEARDAQAFIDATKKRNGYKHEAVPFDDGSPDPNAARMLNLLKRVELPAVGSTKRR
jgi:hypothetical protein